jgi:hypothetical protein
LRKKSRPLLSRAKKASLTEHRSATFLNRTGLERNLALRAALDTNGMVHLALRVGAFLCVNGSARVASSRCAQVLGRIEFLFASREVKWFAATVADKTEIEHACRSEKNEEIQQ